MKSQQRRFWQDWHAYLACFFLPLTLLYTLTGALYLLGLHGSNSSEQEIPLAENLDWPQSSEEAKALAQQQLPASLGDIQGRYFDFDGGHSWYSFDREVLLLKKPQGPVLEVHTHGLWKKLVMIHKGHAHLGFIILGVALGLALLFSLISGVVLAYHHKRYRRTANQAIGLGSAVIVLCYFLPL